MMNAMPIRSLVVLLVLLAACSARSVDDEGASSGSSADPDELDPGDRPTAPGAMFSACMQSSECAPQEFCVFPQGEAGYCTSACTTPTDPGNCEAPPGDQPSMNACV